MNSIILPDRINYQEQIVCDAHRAEPGASLEGDCGCGDVMRSRAVTDEERVTIEIEHLQRVIVSCKERLQALGIHNWEKISEED